MNTATSLASGALGAIVVVLGWLISHSAQIKRLLDLLPTIAADAAKARAVVESGSVGQTVTRVEATLDGDVRAILARIEAKLDGHRTAAGSPPAPTVTTPSATAPTTPAA